MRDIISKKLGQELNQKIILACAKDKSHTLQLSSLLEEDDLQMRGDNNLPVVCAIAVSCLAMMAFVGSAFSEDYIPRWIEDVAGFLK